MQADRRPLRILMTNNTLDQPAGSELYLRDLAQSLMRRGHFPVAYSQTLGPVADRLRAATIPVVDDLRDLSAVPDVIHGQHHLETMTAALRFPQVPVTYTCHGWIPWQEWPPVFPNILHYGRPGEGVELKPGMIFTIEPMVNLGRPHVKVLSDGWTAVTRDRSLSAQFEHSIGITPEGCQIFTTSPKGIHKPGLQTD